MSFGLDEEQDEHAHDQKNEQKDDLALGGASLVSGCLEENDQVSSRDKAFLEKDSDGVT